MANLFDTLTQKRLGNPPEGSIRVHSLNTYPFEAGAELPRRLERVFGDLSRLSAVDLGAGPAETPIAKHVWSIPWRRLVTVEVFGPYLEILKNKSAAATNHELWPMRIENAVRRIARDPEGPPDLALLIDVLEHFPRRKALKLLVDLERIVRLGIVVFSPVGWVQQEAIDGNKLQRHRSTWEPEDWQRLGYDVELYEGFHGHLDPPPAAAWAIKKLR